MVSGSSIFMEKQQQFHRFVILLLWSKFLLFQAWNKYLHKKYWLPTKKRDLSCMVKKTNITHNIQSYINPLNVVQQLNSFNLKFIKHGSNMKFSLVAILVAFTCATVSIRLEFAKKREIEIKWLTKHFCRLCTEHQQLQTYHSKNWLWQIHSILAKILANGPRSSNASSMFLTKNLSMV